LEKSSLEITGEERGAAHRLSEHDFLQSPNIAIPRRKKKVLERVPGEKKTAPKT